MVHPHRTPVTTTTAEKALSSVEAARTFLRRVEHHLGGDQQFSQENTAVGDSKTQQRPTSLPVTTTVDVDDEEQRLLCCSLRQYLLPQQTSSINEEEARDPHPPHSATSPHSSFCCAAALPPLFARHSERMDGLWEVDGQNIKRTTATVRMVNRVVAVAPHNKAAGVSRRRLLQGI